MRNSNGIAKGIAAILVAGVLAAGVCCTGFVSRGDDGKWFGNGNISTWHWKDKTDDKKPDDKPTASGDLLNVVEENGIALMSATIPLSDYEENGISAQAENAYTLTATLTPTNTTYKELEWAISWNTSVSWTSGKTLSDYVTVTPSEDTLSATVECKAPFGAQVQITVTYQHNTEINAKCTVDYRQKYQNSFTGYIALDSASGKKANFSSGADTRISVDLPFTKQSDLSYLGTRNGEISVTANGNDVYTLPMDFQLTQVKMNYSSMMSRSFCEYPAGCDMSGFSERAPLTGVTYTGGKCTGLMQKFMGITSYSNGNLATIKSKLGSYPYDAYFEYEIHFTVNGEEKSVVCRLTFTSSSLAVAATGVNLSSGNIVF